MLNKSSNFRKIVSFIIVLTFLHLQIMPVVYAQGVFSQVQGLLGLPEVGSIVGLSTNFEPAALKAIEINIQNPLEFNFIISKGEETLDRDQKQAKYDKLIKYFLASLTIPEDEMWVNLSPYEKDRVIPEKFSYTEMGRDLLAQDYLLKQITSSLLNPDEEIGRNFWDKIYELAYNKFGTTEIPIDTFNKVWIVPDEAVVFEEGNIAYLIKSHLKVMLEEDYVALQHNEVEGLNPFTPNKDLSISSNIVREIIIPELEKEVNHGKHFGLLRQITSSLILATWYKKTLKESLLSKVYVDKAKVDGIDIEDKKIKEKIYNQYIESFKKGVFNYIKEEYDPASQQIIPRKYFSGGITVGNIAPENFKILKKRDGLEAEYASELDQYQKGVSDGDLDNAMVVLNEQIKDTNFSFLLTQNPQLVSLDFSDFKERYNKESIAKPLFARVFTAAGATDVVLFDFVEQDQVLEGFDLNGEIVSFKYDGIKQIQIESRDKMPEVSKDNLNGRISFLEDERIIKLDGITIEPRDHGIFNHVYPLPDALFKRKTILRIIDNKSNAYLFKNDLWNALYLSNKGLGPEVIAWGVSPKGYPYMILEDLGSRDTGEINNLINLVGELIKNKILIYDFKKGNFLFTEDKVKVFDAFDTRTVADLSEGQAASFYKNLLLNGKAKREWSQYLTQNDPNSELIKFLSNVESQNSVEVSSLDRAMIVNASIPAVTKNINALSGEEITLKLSIEGDDEDLSDKIILHSDVAGRWQSRNSVVSKIGYKDGKNEYEVKLKVETDAAIEFNYTFAVEQEDGSLRWVNEAGQDGIVRVSPKFEGRIATIAMEFAAVAKRAGLGDAVYEKYVEIANSSSEKNRPVVIVPRFKANKKYFNYDKYKWSDVAGFSETLQFKSRADVVVTAQVAIIDGVEVYALNVDDESLFNDIYENKNNEFYESIILSKVGLLLLKTLGLNNQLDVIESADHHAALVSLYMRSIFKNDFNKTASVFAINNIGYPGDYSYDLSDELGLQDYPEIEDLLFIPNKESKKEIQLLAAAVGILGPGNYASTVSPTYAQQVVNTPFGFAADTRLKAAGKYFLGIMNGISIEKWNPETDQLLVRNYSIKDGIDKVQAARKENKRALQKYFSQTSGEKNYFGHLVEGSDRLTLGTNARLVKQKQMDIFPQVIQKAKETRLPIDLVIVGDGEENEKELLETIKKLAEEISNDDSVDINIVYSPFSEDNERRMLGGVDALLMPSDFEPSGLGQLKALLYGALPIVRWTGGLIDSVIGEGSVNQTGFGFYGMDRTFSSPSEDTYRKDQNAQELFETIIRANKVYKENPKMWSQLIENAMNQDVSWTEGVKNHKVIYQLAKEDLAPVNSSKFSFEFIDAKSDVSDDYLQVKTGTDNAMISNVIYELEELKKAEDINVAELLDKLGKKQDLISVNEQLSRYYLDLAKAVNSNPAVNTGDGTGDWARDAAFYDEQSAIKYAEEAIKNGSEDLLMHAVVSQGNNVGIKFYEMNGNKLSREYLTSQINRIKKNTRGRNSSYYFRLGVYSSLLEQAIINGLETAVSINVEKEVQAAHSEALSAFKSSISQREADRAMITSKIGSSVIASESYLTSKISDELKSFLGGVEVFVSEDEASMQLLKKQNFIVTIAANGNVKVVDRNVWAVIEEFLDRQLPNYEIINEKVSKRIRQEASGNLPAQTLFTANIREKDNAMLSAKAAYLQRILTSEISSLQNNLDVSVSSTDISREQFPKMYSFLIVIDKLNEKNKDVVKDKLKLLISNKYPDYGVINNESYQGEKLVLTALFNSSNEPNYQLFANAISNKLNDLFGYADVHVNVDLIDSNSLEYDVNLFVNMYAADNFAIGIALENIKKWLSVNMPSLTLIDPIISGSRQTPGYVSLNAIIAQKNNAMISKDNVGGIDLNPTNINLQIKRDNNNVPLPLEFQDINGIDINGFTPVIINITPVTTLPILLGRKAAPKEVLEVSLN